jgi:hypothetical protein
MPNKDSKVYHVRAPKELAEKIDKSVRIYGKSTNAWMIKILNYYFRKR